MKETFGQKLARLRKEKRLTQEEIASKIYISPQAVSKWENDISSPDISALPQLADILGVSIDELLDHDTSSNTSNTKEEVKEEHKVDDKEFEQILENKINEKFGTSDDEDDEDENENKPVLAEIIINSVFAGLCLVAFIMVGVFWTDQSMGWKMGWILLLVPIVVGSITNAIKKKRITHFAYPVLVVIAYFVLGFLGDYLGFAGWGIYWFLFITIPAFYIIFGPIDNYFKKNKKDNK